MQIERRERVSLDALTARIEPAVGKKSGDGGDDSTPIRARNRMIAIALSRRSTCSSRCSSG